MTNQEKDNLRVRDSAFKNAMALYAAIKDSRSAVINNGKFTDAQDFCCDVATKSRRANLDPGDYAQFEQLLKNNPSNYLSVPQMIRAEIGRQFIMSDMDIRGTYRKLYFRIKRQS